MATIQANVFFLLLEYTTNLVSLGILSYQTQFGLGYMTLALGACSLILTLGWILGKAKQLRKPGLYLDIPLGVLLIVSTILLGVNDGVTAFTVWMFDVLVVSDVFLIAHGFTFKYWT